jgi:hypothetical protein
MNASKQSSQDSPLTSPLASPLASNDWQYVTKGSLDDFDAADWQIINRQRAPYMATQQSRQVLRMLTEAPIEEFEPMVQRLFARTPRLERSATE